MKQIFFISCIAITLIFLVQLVPAKPLNHPNALSAISNGVDPICGPHPLQAIVKKIANTEPEIDHETVVKILTMIRGKSPKLWHNYQATLNAYMNCKVMASGGTLG
uniref:Secreted protein n=1 Tax=Rhabditophanes sp. KR3021 TaxID=114890 RepID=A0AC35U4K1_9BILA